MGTHGIAAALAAITLAVAPAAGAETPPLPSLTVSGNGSVSATPDTGRVSAGVVSEARGAADAVRANSAAMQQVFAALDKAGIPKKDVQTRGFSLSPVYADRPKRTEVPEIVGYRVENTVEVSVQGVEKVGSVLDRLAMAGANQLGGISFSVGEPDPLLDEARRKAFADARRKAEIYAVAAGAKLGRVLRIEEESAPRPGPWVAMARMEAAAPVPVAPGQLELAVTVTVTWSLEP
jgi:uncharacterized protein